MIEPNPYQPRKDLDAEELKTLAGSIAESGILQPILARKVGDRFQIVAGERRWRAAQIAGLEQVPVLCRELSDNDSAVFALVENLQREDLNAIEKAQGIKLLMDQTKATQEQVAKQVGFQRSSVANFLRLLELPEGVQAHVSRGTLTMGHARALLALPDHETMEITAEATIKQGLSVRALESLIKDMQAGMTGKKSKASAEPAKSKKARPVWLNELEESLVEALSTPVTIKYGRKRSQIVIECAGREEFERVFERIKNS
ncbi:MAG: ParB/RepB/Spo0J family partition protein [Planctomycetes bacterium]|nr:ParB/RepB/Spo0J family partition protein [Planctomycetota bacterium]